MTTLSNEQKWALRDLHAVPVNEIDHPSDENKDALVKADWAFSILMPPKAQEQRGMKEWVGTCEVR